MAQGVAISPSFRIVELAPKRASELCRSGMERITLSRARGGCDQISRAQ